MNTKSIKSSAPSDSSHTSDPSDPPRVTTMTREQEIQFYSQQAIGWVLILIRDNSAVRRLLGPGTEAYSRLTKAVAVMNNEPVDTVRERILPGSAAIHRES